MDSDTSKLKHLFFSGIGGSGMSALAQLLAGQGRTISGSDRRHDRGESAALFKKLAVQGIGIFPQDGSGVKPGLDAVIVSAAVESDTPDYRRAVELGLPIIGRPQLLAGLVNRQRGFCIAGTSGKSTVTALAAFVMERAGLKPNFLGGAAVANWMEGATTGNALGGESDLYIVEACESDGSIAGYRPEVGAILNIERDHHELEKLLPMFAGFAAACEKLLVANADCLNLAKLDLSRLGARVLRLSIESRPAELRAEKIELRAMRSRFSVAGSTFDCPLPGRYNVSNTLAALAVCEAAGVSRTDFARILPSFQGVSRRFQVVGEKRGVSVIDDFAHNPSKLAAVLGALEAWPGLRRKIVVFQPHGFGPARFMRAELVDAFARSLRQDDLLVLPEIYYAGGTASKDISSREIVEDIKGRGVNALYFERRAEAIPFITGRAEEGDVVLVAGARDDSLSDFCHEILAAL